MSASLGCVHTEQANTIGAASGWLQYTDTSLQSLISGLLNWGTKVANFNNNNKSAYVSVMQLFCDGYCNTIPPNTGLTKPLRQGIFFQIANSDFQYYTDNLEGKQLEMVLYTDWTNSLGANQRFPIFYFKGVLPPHNNQTQFYVPSSACLSDLSTFQNFCNNNEIPSNRSQFTASTVPCFGDSGTLQTGCFKISDYVDPSPSCDDSRTSDDSQTLHFVISDGVSNSQTFDVSFNLSGGANQEIGLLSPVLSDSAFNALLNVWNSQTGCQARCQFTSGNVRSSCRVKLVCKVYGQSCKVSPSLVPPFVQLNLSEYGGVSAIDRNLLIADFDPCQDNAVSYSEDVTSYIQGLQQNEDFTVGFSFIQVIPYKVVIENCTALNDYCCDDDESVPADDESLGGYTKPLIKGYGGGSSGGGGDDVDITCICTALSNINTTLSAFASANEAALGDINTTLSNLNIDVDNQCICDNLENVVDGLGAIKDSIDDKELSVTNSPTINVAPCQPIVTNPVNNITVTPSTAQITNPVTVQPCQPIVTNPVNNITVTPSTADVNVNLDNSGIESVLSDINSNLSAQNDGLMCDDKSLACILKEALNTSDLVSESVSDVIKNALNTSDNESEGLTDVIKNKDFGSNIDVEVSPADDVNINRVYYTNQRNGDTNL